MGEIFSNIKGKKLKMSNYRWAALVCILILSFKCKHDARTFVTSDCSQLYQPVPFNDLINSPGNYHGHRIEVKGIYLSGTEKSNISKSKDADNKSRIWINFNAKLIDTLEKAWSSNSNVNVFSEISGRTIIIRGVFDTSFHGHLGMYPAAVKQIC